MFAKREDADGTKIGGRPNPLDDNIPVDFLLTVNEVAKCLKVSSQVVHKLARYGHLNKVKVGSLTRIERSELLRFIADGGGDFNG